MKKKMVPTRKSDAWQNALTGLGTSADKSSYNRYRATPQQSGQRLSDLYRTNWLARRLIEAVPARASHWSRACPPTKRRNRPSR